MEQQTAVDEQQQVEYDIPTERPADLVRAEPPRERVVTGRVERAPQQPAGPQPVIFASSEKFGTLAAALAAAQGEFGEIEKSLQAKIESKRTSTTFTYDYAPLDEVLAAVRPPLSKHGIALLQFPRSGMTFVTVRTLLVHGESEQWIVNELTVAIESGGDPKAVGSGITYARRYAILAILGVAPTDDDDAEATMPRGRQQPPRPTPRKSEQAAAPVPANRGRVADVAQRGTAWLVKLTTGYQCMTRDQGLVAALTKARADGTVLTLRSRASTDPSRYAPVLEEITADATD